MVSQRLLIPRLLSATICFLIAITTLRSLIPANRPLLASHTARREVLYLPNGTSLKVITFGYKNAFANLLWFKTVDYFGKHYASDRNYQWLAHMCDLVTTLTPNTPYVYQFCSNMLSWEANAPEQSLKILSKAVDAFPNDWRFRYFRGVTNLFFLKEPEKAREDFVAAATMPGAHTIVKRLAAKTLAQQQDPQTAIEFLENMIRQEQDLSVRKALEQRRDEIVRGLQ
jgi:tetratricopeptide (TPR) repeat protein